MFPLVVIALTLGLMAATWRVTAPPKTHALDAPTKVEETFDRTEYLPHNRVKARIQKALGLRAAKHSGAFEAVKGTRSDYRRSTISALALGVCSLFLFLPETANASVLDTVLGSVGGPLGIVVSLALTAASAFHIWDIIDAKILAAKVEGPTIPAHPKLAEAIKALEQAALHVLQDMATTHILADISEMMKTMSIREIGGALSKKYGPQVIADIQATATKLFGDEIRIAFESEKDLVQNVVMKLGEAGSKVVASAKMVQKTASGQVVVSVLPSTPPAS